MPSFRSTPAGCALSCSALCFGLAVSAPSMAQPAPEPAPPPTVTPTAAPPPTAAPSAAPAPPSGDAAWDTPEDEKKRKKRRAAPPPAGQPPPGQPAPPAGAQPGAQPPPGYQPAPPGYYPPPGYQPPPPGYGYPPGQQPYGYGYPPGYGPYPPAPPPSLIKAVEGQSPPDGYHEDTRIRKGYVIAGSVTFGAAWLLSIATATTFQDDQDSDDTVPLYVPLVGPFITIGTADANAIATFILILDGLAQTTGLGLFIGGLSSPEVVWIRNDIARFTFAPFAVSEDSGGLGVVGEF